MSIDPFPVGTVINDIYEVMGRLGKGGFGTVLKVRNLQEDQIVALKLTTGLGEDAARFEREIRLLEQLKFSGVVPILDFELRNNPPYYVMPIASATLEDQGNEIRRDERTTLDVFKKLCSYLVDVHAQNIFHRDLKPSNVLVIENEIVLADFGLAKNALSESTDLTHAAMGSVEWCAPEQLTTAGTKDADARTDVYQLGKILYWLYIGKSPFSMDLGKLPDGIRQIVAVTTRTSKEERFQDVKSLLITLSVYEKMLAVRGKVPTATSSFALLHRSLTTAEAVGKLKEYLPEEQKRIRLHDLVIGEAERLRLEFLGERFSFLTPSRVYSDLATRLPNYETEADKLLALLVVGGYWGTKEHRGLWIQALERVAQPAENLIGDQNWRILALYPVALLFYGFGIAALAAKKYGTIARLFTDARVVFMGKERGLLELLGESENRVLWQNVVTTTPEVGPRNVIPFSSYLAARLQPALREFLPTEQQFRKTMDRFEYIYALAYGDYYQHESPDGNSVWAPIGLHARRYRTILPQLQAEIEAAGKQWPLLRAGLFGRDNERLLKVKIALDRMITGFAQSYGWWLRRVDRFDSLKFSRMPQRIGTTVTALCNTPTRNRSMPNDAALVSRQPSIDG